MTRNLPDKQVFQGQLCVVRNLPLQADDPIDLWLAPPSCRTLPPEINGKREFRGAGWNELSITKTVGLVQIYNRNVVLRRIQYPAKVFQAGPKLATEINTSSKTNQLWDLKQLVVLLSKSSKTFGYHVRW